MIPPDFIGLGYEISSVAIPGLLSGSNRSYVELVRALSPEGVIRIGGNTSDDARFGPGEQARSAPKGTVINSTNLQQLGTFLDATKWRLIWGLNLGSTDERQAVAEAEAVTATAGHHLLAFEIGNEPDLFAKGTAHRAGGYTYSDFLNEFRRYKSRIRARLPNAPFAGPDVASATDWVTRFAADEGHDLKLLTHHYYRQCVGPTSTLEKLLDVDPKLAPELAKLQAASLASHVPYRICETNSFCGGGQPGVSDSFGAALWVLDFMFRLAYAGCAGVNIETGLNQLGFVSSYSPIRHRQDAGAYIAAPEYFGMLAFAQGSRGAPVAINCQAAGANITAYAVAGDSGNLAVTIINKEPSLDANVSLTIPKELAKARLLRLTGPSLDAKEGVTFGQSGLKSEPLGAAPDTIRVPRASAAVLKW
jgi:hypothetical protein